ncbi:hypothetical protein BU23DRAFT_238544 [Bimuria novae-zelandiae CBS 107.79]|uniref:Uncharacterized protein n=1 Tax=Bimuria novae-zelandiae CBS 107.79 TaxID=1447943 RepID=A0A6A5V0L9_9PLEO|nr:hypothetical protein BU23DRAFT_238544 [Bimuria novae-zelandiae CBS 107.79]
MLFRASESDTTSEAVSEALPETEPETKSRPETQLPPSTQPSTRPSPFQRQISPAVKNMSSTFADKAKTILASVIPPPTSAPVRAETEFFESAIENQASSETDSTVVSKEHEETDQTDQTELSQINWPTVEGSHAVATHDQHDARDRKINLLSNMVAWLLQHQRDGWDGSEEELTRLENIRKEIIGERDNVFATLLNELAGQERMTGKFQGIIRRMVGTIKAIEPETVHAPQAPFTKAIDNEWKLLWERCCLLTRTILNDRNFKSEDFETLEQSIGITFARDPHYRDIIQQSSDFPSVLENDVLLKLKSSLARLLFIFVFEYPSLILQGEHSHLLKHVYTMIGAAGDMSEVKRLDLLATEMLVKENRVQSGVIYEKAEQRCGWISQMLGLNPPPDSYDAVTGDLKELCYRAIKLYSQLLVSPLEYCIHFFPQGTTFDEPSMIGEDMFGTALSTSRCIGGKVKLCLFPAIWQYCAQSLSPTANLADALTANRKFLRSHILDSNVHLSLVSKAVVLLE